jgi:hypothetical protein
VLFVTPFTRLVSNVCWDSLCVLVAVFYLHSSLIVKKQGEKTYFQFFCIVIERTLTFGEKNTADETGSDSKTKFRSPI